MSHKTKDPGSEPRPSPILSVWIGEVRASGEDPVVKREGELTWFLDLGTLFDHRTARGWGAAWLRQPARQRGQYQDEG